MSTKIYKAHFLEMLPPSYQARLLWEGEELTGTDCIGKLCRKLSLLGNGELHVFRNDKLCLTVKNIQSRGKKRLSESKKSGFKLSAWSPFPDLGG